MRRRGPERRGSSSAPALRWLLAMLAFVCLVAGRNGPEAASEAVPALVETVRIMASFGDRSTGTEGNAKAADFIKKELARLRLGPVETQQFLVPVIRYGESTLSVPDRGLNTSIHPIAGNAITPQTIAAPGIAGPLVYAGDGALARLNGKPIEGAILLMEMDSAKNWIQAADLGAKALIYVDRGDSTRMAFEEKFELSPVQFPRFWMPSEALHKLFGEFESSPGGRVAAEVRLRSEAVWENTVSENIYCIIPGSHPERKNELLLVEAFYDSTAQVAGFAPGADEALGAATLIQMAGFFKQIPPDRTVLLAATSGHAQTLAGLRELIWSLSARSRDLRDAKKILQRTLKDTRTSLRALKDVRFDDAPAGAGNAPGDTGAPGDSDRETAEGESPEALLKAALEERIKTDADIVSRRLMRLRLEESSSDQALIQELTAKRQALRRLLWRTSYQGLSAEERRMMTEVAAMARQDQEAILSDARLQLRVVDSASNLRSALREYEVAAAVSLHLSSHGDGFGAFNNGWLYPLRPRINRMPAYASLSEVLSEATTATEQSLGLKGMVKDTLRPSRIRSWQSYFIDRPALGGEVTALAGYLGLTFATTGDARAAWGSPYDLPERVDTAFAEKQSALVCGIIGQLARAPELGTEESLRIGFSTIDGRAKFLRHGELFADKPAPGTVLLCYQGLARFYTMVDQQGRFSLRGVADKSHSFFKVILEGYRFDERTGEAVWVIDKKLTGKNAYRVKMNRRFMETDLVMFAAKGTTLYNLLEPRTFRYLTKADVIDGRRESEPLHYFYSRIDTWSSLISSVFLERGTPLKMTLSDTVLRRKMLLLNASEQWPIGTGYDAEETPLLHRTEYRAASDMWTLLTPRIANLEERGIFNEHIRQIRNEALAALATAEKALADRRYDRFAEASSRAWALATRVYEDVEKTQKDVLYGVLFYIALFVPFAFCLERLLFAYANIYKRIIAFGAILVVLIALIYNVHPAFQLAYSPMVVILAFLIMGLSLIVTLILVFRFEQELAHLQVGSRLTQGGEMGRWKAFAAAFLLGVSNLRRRRLRTALTCITLVILTFTIMSFTSVKSMRQHARVLYNTRPAYHGILLKNVNWTSLPLQALGTVANALAGKGTVVPRVWLEDEDKTRTTPVPLRANGRSAEAQGLLGLSSAETGVSGLESLLMGGRWFTEKERFAALLPDRLAASLGIDPYSPNRSTILLWGLPFEVVGVFSGKKYQERTDLDGEPLTPATFPHESGSEMTEEEVEELESGEDVREFQSRYHHTPAELTVIVPHQTLLAAGGRLKAMAIRMDSPEKVPVVATELVDRFGLSLFSGEPEGTFLYHASDSINYSGIPNIIIPLAISIFIVLNTMIGSVYERKREIGIYTSVGLAPSHVSFLFIAEALAFAVLSVVLGYLLAQTTAKLFSETALWAGITVNYSSLSGVAAIVLVIAVVLVSVLYPSKVAGEIAIPDVNRSWTLPPARGNTIEMVFPFLMTYREHASVGGFIYDYFESYKDVSHGRFSTADVHMAFGCEKRPSLSVSESDCPAEACATIECLHLKSRVWLAPFDFGIMQRVDLMFEPSADEPGFLEIRVRLTRESGEFNAWHRINKGFLHTIRRQLLIWRSLDENTKIQYESILSAARELKPTESAPGPGVLGTADG